MCQRKFDTNVRKIWDSGRSHRVGACGATVAPQV